MTISPAATRPVNDRHVIHRWYNTADTCIRRDLPEWNAWLRKIAISPAATRPAGLSGVLLSAEK